MASPCLSCSTPLLQEELELKISGVRVDWNYKNFVWQGKDSPLLLSSISDALLYTDKRKNA